MRTFCLRAICLLLTSLPVAANAQSREAALAAVMKLPAAERQARLVEGTKKESGLVWYSSTTAEDALALIKKFNEQHPSIQIQHLRSSSEKLLERILTEARANATRVQVTGEHGGLAAPPGAVRRAHSAASVSTSRALDRSSTTTSGTSSR